MVLKFEPPPSDLINSYLNRKSPVEEVNDSVAQALQMYVQQKQQEKQMALAQHASKVGDFNAVKDNLQPEQIGPAAAAIGINIPSAPQPPVISSGTATTPVEAQNQQSMSSEHPGGSSIVQAHAQATGFNPLGLDMSKVGIDKRHKDLENQKLQKDLAGPAPKPVLTPKTHKDILAQGSFDPNKEIAMEPAPEVTRREDIRKEALDERIRKDLTTYAQTVESHPVIKKLNEQQVGIHQVNDMADLVNRGNSVASSAMGTKMAKAMGEVGMLTEQDVKRYVQSGKLAQSAADTLNKWVSGRPSNATMQEISQIAGALKDTFGEQVQPIYNRYIERFARTYDMSNEEAAYKLNFPYQGGGAKVETPKAAPSALTHLSTKELQDLRKKMTQHQNQ